MARSWGDGCLTLFSFSASFTACYHADYGAWWGPYWFLFSFSFPTWKLGTGITYGSDIHGRSSMRYTVLSATLLQVIVSHLEGQHWGTRDTMGWHIWTRVGACLRTIPPFATVGKATEQRRNHHGPNWCLGQEAGWPTWEYRLEPTADIWMAVGYTHRPQSLIFRRRLMNGTPRLGAWAYGHGELQPTGHFGMATSGPGLAFGARPRSLGLAGDIIGLAWTRRQRQGAFDRRRSSAFLSFCGTQHHSTWHHSEGMWVAIRFVRV